MATFSGLVTYFASFVPFNVCVIKTLIHTEALKFICSILFDKYFAMTLPKTKNSYLFAIQSVFITHNYLQRTELL